MKKSNKILSLITSSMLCIQIMSVPMFAMKPTKISTARARIHKFNRK